MPDYPERAVLEGIVNALIHRNYLELGSEVHIDMYDDRLEIYSPGGMYDGINIKDRDIRDVPSRRRNPVIADIFNRLNYMERRGSGFKKILEDYENHPYYKEELAPYFNSENDAFVLTLRNMNYTEVAAKSIDKKYRQKSIGKKVSAKTKEHKKNIILFLTSNGESKTSSIANHLGLGEARTRRIIANMEEIEAVGESRARVYRLKENQ